MTNPSGNNLQVAVRSFTDDVKSALEMAQKRFQFNVQLIEEKFRHKSSGLVYDFNTDEVLFDDEFCTVDSDEDIIKALHRENKSLSEDSFGSTVMSAPCAAPEDSSQDEERIQKINKLFHTLHNLPKPYTRLSPAAVNDKLPALRSSRSLKAIAGGPSTDVTSATDLKALPVQLPKKPPTRRRSMLAIEAPPPEPPALRRLSSRRVVTGQSASAVLFSGAGKIILRSHYQEMQARRNC